jgi:alpha-D-ribose 1-methylphosphonate 5-triphosphate synthase subunit PhnL
MLRVRHLRKSFENHLRPGQARPVLTDVDLYVAPGSCVVLTGASGSGKSSLLRCVYGTYRPDAGRIELATPQGTLELATASEREILAARCEAMSMVTQFLSVTPRVPALDLVARQGLSRGDARLLLLRLGLPEEIHGLPPVTFSGGERQLVNLAMALARPRPLLLIDEATASLDQARRNLVLSMLAERKRAGTSILAVFHDLPPTADLVDGIVQLTDGHVKERS